MTDPNDPSDASKSVNVEATGAIEPDNKEPDAVRAIQELDPADSSQSLGESPGRPSETGVAAKAICDATGAIDHLIAIHTITKTANRGTVKMKSRRETASNHLRCARDYMAKVTGSIDHIRSLPNQDGPKRLAQDFTKSYQYMETGRDQLAEITHRRAPTSQTDSDINDALSARSTTPSGENEIGFEGVSHWKETARDSDPSALPPLPTVEMLTQAATEIAQGIAVLNIALGEIYNHIIVSPDQPPKELTAEDTNTLDQGPPPSETAQQNTPPVAEFIPSDQTPLIQTQ